MSARSAERVSARSVQTLTASAPVRRTAVKPAGKRKKKVPPKNLAVFTRQLSVMIDAGLPLVQCLELLSKEEPDKGLAEAVHRVQTDVEAGASLAEAMERQPHAFNALFTHMVSAGEAGGILDTILKRLSTYIEKQVKLQSQVKSAMIYPAAVMTIAVLVIAVMFWLVVPAFSKMFEGLNATLPLPTRVLIAVSTLFVYALPFLVAGVFAAAYFLRRYYATPAGRLKIDGLLLKVPLLGKILRKVAVARFCRTLSTLISSGVPILTGLDVTARASGNAVVEDAIKVARVRIERGESIAVPLRATGVFPPMVSQMIGAGESTGALDVMLSKIAEFYEEEVEVAVAGLLTVLEPIMIAFLGVVVGGIIIAMYLPLFELINQLS
jgi:type IV pilus assembly protein PilC